VTSTFDAGAFMPPVVGAYRYEGSLTTPPCSRDRALDGNVDARHCLGQSDRRFRNPVSVQRAPRPTAQPALHSQDVGLSFHRDARHSHGANVNMTTPNSVSPISTQLKVYSKVGNWVQLTDNVVTMVATPIATPARG